MDLIPSTGARSLPERSTTSAPVNAPGVIMPTPTCPPTLHYPMPSNDGGSWSVSPDGTVTVELWINGKRWRPCGY